MREDFWEIILSDPPDKEEPVAEIYYKNEQCFEINYEDYGFFVTKFYNKRDANYWEFPYEESIEVLQEAKDHLAKLKRTPEQQAEYDAMKKELENWNPTPEETAEYERKMEEQRKKYYG
ncbi:hypothetical protein [Candidatus Neptunichlamydia sp. REUL1]|uniref:hypothetical protein n=1 Tax=Candidatus Neptunichlamydia sp. REUL1 TaxID=3064277 RepID=UPI00292FE05F|nr:hypothetical protein [Candidatus Neptunochlamydia sp. REUL1]